MCFIVLSYLLVCLLWQTGSACLLSPFNKQFIPDARVSSKYLLSPSPFIFCMPPISLSILEGPSWLSVTNNGTFSFTGIPANEDVGRASVKFTVKFKNDMQATDSFTFSVVPFESPPILNSPLFNQLLDNAVLFDENTKTIFIFPESSATFAASRKSFSSNPTVSAKYISLLEGGKPLPQWLAFDNVTLEFVATPKITDVGNYSVELIAKDSFGTSKPDLLSVSVITELPNSPASLCIQANSGTPFNYTLPTLVSKSNRGFTLTPTIKDYVLPSFINFNGASIFGTPTSNDSSISLYIFRANKTVVLNINLILNGNHIPKSVRKLPVVTATAGHPFKWQVPMDLFIDEDGEPLSYNIVINEKASWMTYNSTSKMVSGIVPNSPNPNESFELQVVAKNPKNAAGFADLFIIVEKEALLSLAIIILLTLIAILILILIMAIFCFRKSIGHNLRKIFSQAKTEDSASRITKKSKKDAYRVTKPELFSYPFKTAAETYGRNRDSDILPLPPPMRPLPNWGSEKNIGNFSESFANLNGLSILGVSPILPVAVPGIHEVPSYIHMSASIHSLCDNGIAETTHADQKVSQSFIPQPFSTFRYAEKDSHQHSNNYGFGSSGKLLARLSKLDESTLPTLTYDSAHLVEMSEVTAFAMQNFRFMLPNHILHPNSANGQEDVIEVVWRRRESSVDYHPLPGWMHYNHFTGTIWGTPTMNDLGMVELDFYRLSVEANSNPVAIFLLRILISG